MIVQTSIRGGEGSGPRPSPPKPARTPYTRHAMAIRPTIESGRTREGRAPAPRSSRKASLVAGVALLTLVVLATLAIAHFTTQAPTWYLMSDELLWEKLGLSIFESGSPLPHVRGVAADLCVQRALSPAHVDCVRTRRHAGRLSRRPPDQCPADGERCDSRLPARPRCARVAACGTARRRCHDRRAVDRAECDGDVRAGGVSGLHLGTPRHAPCPGPSKRRRRCPRAGGNLIGAVLADPVRIVLVLAFVAAILIHEILQARGEYVGAADGRASRPRRSADGGSPLRRWSVRRGWLRPFALQTVATELCLASGRTRDVFFDVAGGPRADVALDGLRLVAAKLVPGARGCGDRS